MKGRVAGHDRAIAKVAEAFTLVVFNGVAFSVRKTIEDYQSVTWGLTTSPARNILRTLKAAAHKPNRRAAEKVRPRMTRELAEARAVGGGKGKFDGVAFLRTLKK